MNYINELDETLNEVCDKFQKSHFFKAISEDSIDIQLYSQFLAQTYHYVLYTPVTLGLCAKSLENKNDSISPILKARFKEHEHEEMGHEKWILNDLKNLGIDPGIVNQQHPHISITTYNNYSKFAATSEHPESIFGEAFILEGIAEHFGMWMGEKLSVSSKISNISKGLTFLKGHGYTDKRHMKELRELLLSITDLETQKSIVLCAKVVGQLYVSMIQSLH